MTPLRLVGTVAVVGVMVFSMGRCSAPGGPDGPGESEREPAPAVTKVVKGDTKTVTKYKMPGSCMKALDNLDAIIKAASGLGDAGNPQLDLMSQAHEAIAEKDFQRLVTLQDRQNKLNDKTTEHVKNLEVDLLPYYRRYEKECKAAK
jgi:hypothetical protein